MQMKINIPRVSTELKSVNDFTNYWSKCEEENQLTNLIIIEENISEENFFHTTLLGFDFSGNEMADLVISDSLEEIKGSRISPSSGA